MEIYIAEAIAKRRRELNLTQEELASRLGVSAQAVSNWERKESYPDITLLPALSAALALSTDFLLGVGRETDEQIIEKWHAKMKEAPEREGEIVLSFYHAYPGCHPLMEALCWWIYRCAPRDPALRDVALEMAKRILEECTVTDLRLSAATVLSFLCEDDREAEQYMDLFCTGIKIKPNIIARRAYDRGERQKAQAYFDLEHLWVFLYFCSRSAYCKEEHEKGVRYYALRESMIKAAGNGTVPDGLLGTYSTLKLFHSAALFGKGYKDEGYSALEEAVSSYEKWCSFDKEQVLSLGELSFDGSVSVRHVYTSGQHAAAIYVGTELFGIRGHGILPGQNKELVQTMFAPVLQEERFKQLIEKIN